MKYDAIIIGSGQGGNPLARRLADLGKTIALIERKDLGGTCINTGCTPTKTMIASAQVAHYARNAMRWGVRTTGATVNLPSVGARKDRIVHSFRSGQQRNVDARKNLHLYRGEARFLTSHHIKVGERQARSPASTSPEGIQSTGWSGQVAPHPHAGSLAPG